MLCYIGLLLSAATSVATPDPSSSPQTCGGKTIVGPTVYVQIEEANQLYLARTDTGSTNVSLHAWDLQIDNPAKEMRDNLGKIVRFKTANEKGQQVTGRARIVDTVKIRSSNGSERRYVVELTIPYAGGRKVVEANLSEREKMTYPLLLGRNWLAGNYLVDVELPEFKP
ncbi:RimK/LysX family protein [Parendozoicomonas sp. Alg238-R29]|uniref:ATP-dependent zinc protease family protein n=1 Tax=Parendozoicomonas sp. Alg238-R29 TaxID=2993446 RepID=UPI00248D4365|nr:RimK/LysX family protein [Parendozoicomonas sp. Alg238-R29]